MANNAIYKDFFVYQENFDNLTNGTSQQGNINIQANSDFVLQKLTMFADISGGSQTYSSRVIPLVNVQITDTGSGNQLFESSIPAFNLFGTGELPFILPTPKLFSARSTIAIAVSNFSSSTDYNIKFSLIGHKLYRAG